MIKMAKWILAQWVMVVVCLVSASVVRGASQEIRPPSELSGTIAAPMEERKQALSSGDKIFVSLDTALPVKKGDKLEIFQQATLTVDGKPALSFIRAGEIIVLELVNDRLLLGIIESSTREIAVGDRIYFPAY